MHGTVKTRRRQGRQRKRSEDIREWTGLEFAKSQRTVENREKWRILVVKSFVISALAVKGQMMILTNLLCVLILCLTV